MDGADPCKIGIMHPAFRVGKVKLMNWVNDFLETDYAKVEDCADGAVYVQLCDSIWTLKDGQMKKIKWGSRSKTDWSDNWKIVQNCFNKHEVSKPIDVAKIINGKFQDNLEVMQWFKHFHESKFDGRTYKPKARRNLSKSAPKKSKKPKQRKKTPIEVSMPVEKKGASKKLKRKNKAPDKTDKILEVMEQLEKATLTIEAVEKERNFYFGKLREIEILCQEDENTPIEERKFKTVKELQQAILAIMYKTDDAGIMESPADEGDANQESGNQVEEHDLSAGLDNEGGNDETF